MANNPDSPDDANYRETYHEVPASKYWYLGDVIGAVPKNFFKFWTPFTFLLGVVLTYIILETNWFTLLLVSLFLGENWFVGWFGTLILACLITIYFLRKHQKKKFK
jgi:hypothetical protein